MCELLADPFHPVESLSLPIFRAETEAGWLYYAPGALLRISHPLRPVFEALLSHPQDHFLNSSAQSLVRAARKAEQDFKDWQYPVFNPLCLMLYLNQDCNLRCSYCFSDLEAGDSSCLEGAAVLAAARIVASACKDAAQPLVVVFHGGGEPVLAWRTIDSLFPGLEQISSSYGVSLFTHISTNGVMSAARARWLGSRFSDITLSIDGPPEIQDRQRPTRSGSPSSPLVQQTVAVLRQMGKPFSIRVTLTSPSFHRQAEIAAYLCRTFSPTALRVEPVYGSGVEQISPEEAPAFVRSYREAQQVGRAYGVEWSLSAARAGQVHGAYCQVFRQVLHLLPGGAASACFKTINSTQAARSGLAVGAYRADTGAFELDADCIRHLQARYEVPARCLACINVYHCTHGCPDACLLPDPPKSDTGLSGRCMVLRAITAGRLLEAARLLDPAAPAAFMALGTSF